MADVKKPKKRDRKVGVNGVAHIQASFNNTIVTITDGDGAVITWASAGLPSLVADLQDYWPECEQDLTGEIAFAMRAAPTYRAKHGARRDHGRQRPDRARGDCQGDVPRSPSPS